MSKDNMTMSTPNDDLHRANCVAYKMVVEHSSRFLVASQFQEALSYLIQASCVCTRCAYSHFSAYPYFGTFLALLIELPNPHDRQLIVRLLLEICAVEEYRLAVKKVGDQIVMSSGRKELWSYCASSDDKSLQASALWIAECPPETTSPQSMVELDKLKKELQMKSQQLRVAANQANDFEIKIAALSQENMVAKAKIHSLQAEVAHLQQSRPSHAKPAAPKAD